MAAATYDKTSARHFISSPQHSHTTSWAWHDRHGKVLRFEVWGMPRRTKRGRAFRQATSTCVIQDSILHSGILQLTKTQKRGHVSLLLLRLAPVLQPYGGLCQRKPNPKPKGTPLRLILPLLTVPPPAAPAPKPHPCCAPTRPSQSHHSQPYFANCHPAAHPVLSPHPCASPKPSAFPFPVFALP